MSERIKSSMGWIVTLLLAASGAIWVLGQKAADVAHLNARIDRSEMRIDKIESHVSEVQGDIKAIRVGVDNLNRKLP